MPRLPIQTVQAIHCASNRSAATVHAEMNQGLNSLATIVSIAPWIGVLGTLYGIVNSFLINGGERWAMFAAVTRGLSESIWPTALGLLVGLTSLWFYKHLTGKLEIFDSEMDTASRQLVDVLAHFPGRFATTTTVERPSAGPLFGEKYVAELLQYQKSRLTTTLLTGAALFVAWSIQALIIFDSTTLPLWLVALNASGRVLYMFGLSCFPAYLAWIALFHRRYGAMVALASALCSCWSVIDLVLYLRLL